VGTKSEQIFLWVQELKGWQLLLQSFGGISHLTTLSIYGQIRRPNSVPLRWPWKGPGRAGRPRGDVERNDDVIVVCSRFDVQRWRGIEDHRRRCQAIVEKPTKKLTGLVPLIPGMVPLLGWPCAARLVR